jgi:hypothetical protein
MNARCTGDTCKELKTQTAEEAMKCTKPQTAKEEIDGCKSALSTSLGKSSEFDPANNLVGLPNLPGNRMIF